MVTARTAVMVKVSATLRRDGRCRTEDLHGLRGEGRLMSGRRGRGEGDGLAGPQAVAVLVVLDGVIFVAPVIDLDVLAGGGPVSKVVNAGGDGAVLAHDELEVDVGAVDAGQAD